jgi:hypothetical protein
MWFLCEIIRIGCVRAEDDSVSRAEEFFQVRLQKRGGIALKI